MSSFIKINPPIIGENIKVEVIRNVVQIESSEPVFIQIKRGEHIEQFQETACCMCKCPKCGKIFSVFMKSSDLKCPECVEQVEGFWTYCLVNTGGQP